MFKISTFLNADGKRVVVGLVKGTNVLPNAVFTDADGVELPPSTTVLAGGISVLTTSPIEDRNKVFEPLRACDW